MNNNMYTNVRTILAGLALLSGTQTVFAQFNWGSAGPVYTSGRARNMVVDKNNSNTLYVGSASGGIFKSTDAGANWAPIDDQGNVRNISYMAQAVDGSIFVGTGEGFLRFGQKLKAQVGTGLYKLQGTSLTQMATAASVGTVINRIACSPANANNIALATNLGIMISIDGGQTFTAANITPAFQPNVRYGLTVQFNNAGILYCTVGNERGGTTQFDNAKSKIYKATDASMSSFTDITPTHPSLINDSYGRIELGIAPSDNNVIYASLAFKNITTTLQAVPNAASLNGIFVSVDGGSSWDLIAQGAAQFDPLSNGGSVATGDYAQVLTVHPTNPYTLFFGGYSAFRYTANSSNPANGTWSQLGFWQLKNTQLYMHENIHDIKIVPGTPTRFYYITDAGIFRSIDNNVSFQAYYKGLVIGQFNSVSIERYPSTFKTPGDTSKLTPHFGYIGGTGGNGLVYYSGTATEVIQENSYLGGEVYNAEYSKILPEAAYFTSGTGGMFRSTNVKSSQPTSFSLLTYSGILSDLNPIITGFTNTNARLTTGTPFNLWENYGQVNPSPDSVIFYNDSLRFPYSISSVATLTTISTFTYNIAKPNKFAQLDSIAIRTGTVELPIDHPNSKVPTPFTGSDKKDILIKLSNQPVPVTTIAVPSGTTSEIQFVQVYQDGDLTVTGPADLTGLKPLVRLNSSTNEDYITITFTAPPFASKTTASYTAVSDPALYYRVFATAFYKYKVGDTVSVTDNNISTKPAVYTTTLSKPLSWTYPDSASKALVNGMVAFSPNNRPVMIPAQTSARLAMFVQNPGSNNQAAIVVSKAPLNVNDPMHLVRVSQNNVWKDDASGNPTNSTISWTGKPTLIKWSHSGTELYFATSDNKIYRVSHIGRIMDFSPSSYSGKFNTDVFRYYNALNSTTLNPESPYRTTQIASFNKPITSISISNDDTRMLVTLDGSASGSDGTVYYSGADIRKTDLSNQTWANKDAGHAELASQNTYCSLLEMNNDKEVYIGTNRGIVHTSDISANPVSWTLANNGQLPSVQVFDIEQQDVVSWSSYNSGEIYVATNGRGVWSSRLKFVPYVTGIEEQESVSATAHNNLFMFPNPASEQVTLGFRGIDGEKAIVQVMDMSGRLVHAQELGALQGGDQTHVINTENVKAGMYILNISSTSGVQRVSKLVISK